MGKDERSGMSDARFGSLMAGVFQVITVLILTAGAVAIVWGFQPIVSDLAGESTDVRLNFAFSLSIIVNVVLAPAVCLLIWRLVASNRRIRALERKRTKRPNKTRSKSAARGNSGT